MADGGDGLVKPSGDDCRGEGVAGSVDSDGGGGGGCTGTKSMATADAEREDRSKLGANTVTLGVETAELAAGVAAEAPPIVGSARSPFAFGGAGEPALQTHIAATAGSADSGQQPPTVGQQPPTVGVKVNDNGFAVNPGLDSGCEHLMYCGQRANIPRSDGK
jgi:hypothetical protein